MFAGNYAPEGWAFCAGQLVSISDNQALYSLLGTTYGGDGRSSFRLPDLRGRVPMGMGQHPGSQYDWRIGQQVGKETVQLSVENLPAHNHPLMAQNVVGASADPSGRLLSNTGNFDKEYSPPNGGGTAMASEAIGKTGNGTAVPNMQPSLCVNFIIALEGTYPPRS